MKKFVVLILAVGFVFLGVSCKKDNEQDQANTVENENQAVNEDNVPKEETQVKELTKDLNKGMKISFIADFEGSDGIEFEYKGDNITIYSLLEIVTKEKGLSFDIRNVDFGKYVFAIGGKQGGENGKFWNLYINGNMSDEGVDKVQVKPGDQVDFKFESSEEQTKQDEQKKDEEENQEGENPDETEEKDKTEEEENSNNEGE